MKKHLHTLLYGLAVLFAVLFGVSTAVSWVHYQTALTSAPFYLMVLANGAICLLPAVIFAVIGLILHRKKNKTERSE